MARRSPQREPPRIEPARVAGLQAHLLGWYAANGRDLPWRRTCDPYAVLVSEVMLQQTQVVRVVPRYEAFMTAYPTLEDLAAAPLADVLSAWRGLGYNNRARRLRECAAAVAACGRPRVTGRRDRRGAALPRTLEGLLGLPGIGPYTARAVLVFAHNADLAAVDANVRRVLTHELGLEHGIGDRPLQAVADAVLPRGRSRDWHNALMDYGALVLTARATGIPPRTRQTAFAGSRRWYRSRLLGALLDGGPLRLDDVPQLLGLAAPAAADIVSLLEADGLVRRDGDLVRVA